MADGQMLSAWDSYQRIVLPPTASETQRTETRRAFYSGAHAMFTAMMAAASDPGANASDADCYRVDSLHREVRYFFALIEKGLA